MSTPKPKNPEFEIHEPCEQAILFVVERLDYDMKWRPALTVDFKHKGKFLLYQNGYRSFLKKKEAGPDLSFKDEGLAVQIAKSLSRQCDRPLRIQKVQTIRIQRQIGKVILPQGGV